MDCRVPADFSWIVSERLIRMDVSPIGRRAALSLLSLILAALQTQTYACRETLIGLAVQLGMDTSEITGAMKLLHEVGAVTMIVHGKRRCIAVTPPGVRLPGRAKVYPETGAIGRDWPFVSHGRPRSAAA